MITSVKRFAAFIMALVMTACTLCAVPFSACAYDVSEQSLYDVSTSDWMSVILDGTKLTEITMPGTHDSCARKFKTNVFNDALLTSTSKCQSMNITEQLNAGVRFLDIRCEVDPSTYSVKTVHGEADCWNGNDYYYLDFVFQDIYNWLDAHPSETVCVCIKEDYGDNGVPSFTNAIYEYIHGYGQGKYFYGSGYDYHNYWYLGKSVPTLGAVRGKCVLFNRFDQYIGNEAEQGVVVDENESGQKIKYNDFSSGDYKEPCYENIYSYQTGIGTAHIQDYYKWNTESKIAATQYMLNLGHYRGEYYINYSSTVSDSDIPNPENLSKKVNPNYYSFNYTRNKPSGIYCMDFATADLARQIILNNEAVCAKLTGTYGNISYTLNRKTGTLTVSGNGDMNNYAYSYDVGVTGGGSNSPWGDQPKSCLFEGQYNTDLITNIVVEEGITSIGSYAFYGFDHLQSVTLPSTIRSIGEGAFARCESIKDIDISHTGTTSIGTLAFLGCTSLETFETADSVQTIGENAFGFCSRMTMYGSSGIPSQTYANENSITYHEPIPYYSINYGSGNNYKESTNPFAGRDLSNGVTISFSKYCATDDDWNSSILSFSSGDVNDNRYFIFMGNGAVFFNDGNGGVNGYNGCYFDLRTSGSFNTAASRWVDVVVTIYKNDNGNHILKYYTDGTLAAEYNLNSVCASGYPYGISGDDGVFSYLASEDINLYYGSSYTIYGTMGGTADSYIDDVRLYAYALSPQEIGAFDTSLCYDEAFDDSIGGTGYTRQSNDGTQVCFMESNDGRNGCPSIPYSDGGTGNYIKAESDWSPFVGSNTSDGFTVSFFQRVNGNIWNGHESISVTFAQGEISENKYFTIGSDGYIRFNNGNGGSDGSLSSAGLYFDYTESPYAFTKQKWTHIAVTILSDYRFKIYVDGVLRADVTVTGTDNYANTGGLLSFLASANTRLYYGSYTPYWGTHSLSFDNFKCFDRALSQSEISSLYRYEAESKALPVLENTFGTDYRDKSGFCEWAYGKDEKRGVLHFASGSANGNVDIYVNGTKTTNTSSIAIGSTIKAVYTGSGSITGWVNNVTNELGTSTYYAEGNEYEFTLEGDSVVFYKGARTSYNADLTAFLEAYAKAQTYSAEKYSDSSFAALQTCLTDYANYANYSLSQEQIDDATADILTAISDLKPYLTLSVTAENGTPNTDGGQVLFGDMIELNAIADYGYEFFAWYETKTHRLASYTPSFSFTITSNTELQAIFVEQNSCVLRFENASGQLVKYVAKTADEWAAVTDLSALAPTVPYRYGYANGAWNYGGALADLQRGMAALVTPEYTALDADLPALPSCIDAPAVSLSYQLDGENNVGSFVMALNVPDGVRVQSIGTAFYYAEASNFTPHEFDLTITNEMTTSKFAVGDEMSGIYITNINNLSSRYNWAAKGYVTYYDTSGKLRTAYSNQINIINRVQV